MGRLTRLLAPTCAAVLFTVVAGEAFNLVVAHTQKGLTYKVNQQHAHQFIGFINDLEKMHGPIRHLGCYARWGHVPMSQHHVGNACDIEQYGWGRTSYRAMYRIGWLARKWGLRDGCSFGDCGHVDAGGRSWVNGGPPGLLARAELPYTPVDLKKVNIAISGEWPVLLPAKSKQTFGLAGEEKPYKPKGKRVRGDDRYDNVLLIIKYNKHQQMLDNSEDVIRRCPSTRRVRTVLVDPNAHGGGGRELRTVEAASVKRLD